MEHLPAPHPCENKILVPYLHGSFDGGPFESYLERQGTNLQRLLRQAHRLWNPTWARSTLRFNHSVASLLNWFKKLPMRDDEDRRIVNEVTDFIEATASLEQVDASGTVCELLEQLDRRSKRASQDGYVIQENKVLRQARQLMRLSKYAYSDSGAEHDAPVVAEEVFKFLKRRRVRETRYPVEEVESGTEEYRLVQLLQNWLFFGVLHEMFQGCTRDVRAADFVVYESSGAWLTTKNLHRYLKSWKEDHDRKDSNSEGLVGASSFAKFWKRDRSRRKKSMNASQQAASREANAMAILANIQRASQIAAEFERVQYGHRIAESSITFSVILLCDALQKHITDEYKSPPAISWTCSYLRTRFLDAGWCPNQIVGIESYHPLAYQYYIYSLGRAASLHSHEQCTVLHCVPNQVVESTYRITHTFDRYGVEYSDPCPLCHIANSYRKPEDDCSDLFEPNPDDLLSIVESGGIPLISIYDANIEPYYNDPKIVRYVPGRMNYVAISHVWADGLGNPSSNAVRLCQIGSLSAALVELGASGNDSCTYFWLDTVCVPLKPLSARRAAIKSVSTVFAEARTTLVMTHDLRRIPVPPTALETVTRILVSNWTRRLWTYSEAMYSTRLAFKFENRWVWFQNKLVELEKEIHQTESLNYFGGRKGLLRDLDCRWARSDRVYDHFEESLRRSKPVLEGPVECLRQIDQLAAQFESNQAPTEVHNAALYFLLVIQGLPWKATSNAFDEIICLSQLRGLSIDQVPNDGSETAMEMFLALQYAFPRRLALINGKRMTKEGYRWAPRSFLGDGIDQRGVNATFVSPLLALLSSEGLVFHFPGIVFEPCRPFALEHKDVAFILPINLTDGNTVSGKQPAESSSHHVYEISVTSPFHEPLSHEAWDNLAIILDAPGGLPLPKRAAGDGILVEIRKSTPELISTRFLCAVDVKRLETSGEAGTFWTFNESRDLGNVLTPRKIIAHQQGWCVA